MDIFQLLKQDHEKVSAIFEKLDKTTSRGLSTREKLFAQLDEELSIHAAVEENIFYPVLEEFDETRDIVLEGIEEHQIVKQLLAEMGEMPKDDEQWEAKCKVLSEMVEHHVNEEEKEMFPKARKVLGKARANEIAEEVEKEKIILKNEGVGSSQSSTDARL